MAKFKPENILNIALAGHGGTGKTTLVDEILFATKKNTRIGSTKDGTSLSDTAPDEIEAQASIDLSVLYTEHNKKLIHLLDTPGRSDFIGQLYCALRAVETVLITIDASAGIQVNTRKAWKLATSQNKAIAIILTKLDAENIELDARIKEIQETFGTKCAPFYLPNTTGSQISTIHSVLHPDENTPDFVKKFSEPLIESIVESNEELMEKYLEGENVQSEVETQISTAIAQGDLVPILAFSQKNSLGIQEILHTITTYLPPASSVKTIPVQIPSTNENNENHENPTNSIQEIELNQEIFVAQVFKTVVDEHKGKLALIRTFSGNSASGKTIQNVSKNKNVKFGKLFKFFGNKHEEIQNITAGEIFAAAKIEDLNVEDTLSDGNWQYPLTPLGFPTPMVALAVRPKTRSDEQRISSVLSRYATEDPTFRFETDPQTKEMVIYGMSELHLNTILNRMSKRHNVNVDTKLPRISYRETITKEATASYRHKKQTGGAGEFAEVHLRIRPYKAKDKDLNFINALRGDNVGRQFVPSVEKGCRSIMEQGILTKSPIIWVEVEFFDGKDHPVDSKDVAFQKAGKECFKICFLNANPVLLEPIVDLEISAPTEFAGDITQYLNSHRGKITGIDVFGSEQVIKCNIPLAEVQTISSDLRSMTQDQSSYSMEFAGYEPTPPHIQQQVIEKFKQEEEQN